MNQVNGNDLRHIFLTALRNALTRLVISDGSTTDAEISAFISVWRQATGESIDAPTARVWCAVAAQDKLPADAHFKTLAGVVNDAGKDLAFKAAFVLCVSDGALQQPETDLLNLMAAHFQFDRERVARLIGELSAAPPQTTPHTPAPAPRNNPGYARLAVLLIIGFILYSAVRYFIDRSQYQKGHEAYQRADCITAMENFDKVIAGWRLGDFGGYAALSEQENAECLPFQAAVEMQKNGDLSGALSAYTTFININDGSVLAEAARNNSLQLFKQNEPAVLASVESCGKISGLLDGNLLPSPDETLPSFYLACGQVFDSSGDSQSSFMMFKSLITEYPSHSFANNAEAALLENAVTCERADSLQSNNTISSRPDFMPRLYYKCGQTYEEDRDWSSAISMYEAFLAEFPEHTLAPEAEAGLARAIIAQAKAAGAGDIPAPERSGSTYSGQTEVVIQNDSPERLRIVFSGPETRIEELAACSSCINYTGIGPLYCPEMGPIGRYTLEPGEYEVVVESITDSGVTPWTGTWALGSGDEYSSCFFLVTRTFP